MATVSYILYAAATVYLVLMDITVTAKGILGSACNGSWQLKDAATIIKSNNHRIATISPFTSLQKSDRNIMRQQRALFLVKRMGSEPRVIRENGTHMHHEIW